MKAAIYTRISMDRTGQSLGVQRQEQDCRELAEKLGWDIVATYTDNDLSAYSGKTRPGFEKLLTAMKAGEVDGLTCWHPDRLYRTLKDLVRLLEAAKGIEIRTVNGGEIDLSTSTGRMLATILGSVSTQEIEHKSERQRRAARQKAESGAPKWKRAFGYLETPTGPIADPKVAPLVKQAYSAVLAGSSLNDVCRLWNDAGALTLRGKRWTAPAVSTFLRKPRNAGLRTYQAGRGAADRASVIGKGTWQALVDEELFWSVQAVMDAPGRAPGKKTVRKYLLTNVLCCGRAECGGKLAGRWLMHRSDDGHSIVYVCNRCRKVSVRADIIEPIVYRLVIGTLEAPDAIDLLKAEQHDTAEAEALRVERATLLARLGEIADERADGLLTGPQARRATDRINDKLTAIDARQADQERLRVFDGIPLGTPEVAGKVRELSADRLRAVLDVLCTIAILPVGKGGKEFKPERVQVQWR